MINRFPPSHDWLERYDPLRIFKPSDVRELIASGDASISVDEKTGTVLFRYGRYGMAYSPKVNAWSAPLDFEEQPNESQALSN